MAMTGVLRPGHAQLRVLKKLAVINLAVCTSRLGMNVTTTV